MKFCVCGVVLLFITFNSVSGFSECLEQDKVPNKFIVRLKKAPSSEYLPQAISENQQFKNFLVQNKIKSEVLFDINRTSGFSVQAFHATPPATHVLNITPSQAEAISTLDYVDTVEPDCYYKIQGDISVFQNTNDPLISDMWGIKKIKADQAWDVNKGSVNTIVAISDTGVDYNHEDLKANMWVNTKELPGNGIDDDGDGCVDDIYGCDFADEDGNPMPDNSNLSHGTHVAGTVAAVGNNGKGVTGIVQTAKIMALKGFNSFGQGDGAALLQTIYFAVNNGARVINCSWGRSGSYNQSDLDAFEYAYNHGVTVVVAAGNNNQDAASFVPANLPHVITVAATDSNDQIATFSNWGTTVEVAAPGGRGYDASGNTIDGILSTLPNNTYGKYIGTSMAAPHVAGLAALILSINPNLSPSDVLKMMQDGGDLIHVTTTGSGKKFDYKRINALGAANLALASLGTSNNPCPPGSQNCSTSNSTGDHNLPAGLKGAFTQGSGCGSISKVNDQKNRPDVVTSGLLLMPLILAFNFRLFLKVQKQ